MDAAADYAAARAMLARTLPAYVSYVVRAHVKMDAIVRDQTEDVVVRTRDGKILKGNPGAVPGGFAGNTGNEPVSDPAFKPKCYEAQSAAQKSLDGRQVEAIALRYTCRGREGDKDFETLYVDPVTHAPVMAEGEEADQHVDVRLEQRFTRTGTYVLPSTLYVRVRGSGFMFWLDVEVDERYTSYKFSDKDPT